MDNANTVRTQTATSVGVLDRIVTILETVEQGPQTLNDLATTSGIPRPSVHRLAVALEKHDLLTRDAAGRFRLGTKVNQLAAATQGEELAAKSQPVLRNLRDTTGESSQLFRREGGDRVCIATADLGSGLRDTVPLNARLPLSAGSAAQVLLAWENPDAVSEMSPVFSADDLARVRSQGWAASVQERSAGVSSVSAPVRAPDGVVVAAISVSGPSARFGDSPGETFGAQVCDAAQALQNLVFEVQPTER